MTGKKPSIHPDHRVGPPKPDERGRPEPLTGEPRGTVYGEPKGPRPPHIERLPKEEIERRAAAGTASATTPAGKRLANERSQGNFYSGMTSPEAFETTGDEHPKLIRRTDPLADAQETEASPVRPEEGEAER